MYNGILKLLVWNMNKCLNKYTNTTKSRVVTMPTLSPLATPDIAVMAIRTATGDDKGGPVTAPQIVWRKLLTRVFIQVI